MTERNKTIDKLRGICMLGVLGIHTGSLVLMSVSPNQHLYMLFEILSRYSVPAFFFVSGYGLFCHYKPGTEINYRQFIKKRFQSSGIPYLSWSLFLYGIFYNRCARLHSLVFSIRIAAHTVLGTGMLPFIFYDYIIMVLCFLSNLSKTAGCNAETQFKNRLCRTVFAPAAV